MGNAAKSPEYRAWIIRNREKRWVPIGRHASIEVAVQFAAKKYRSRLLAVRVVPKPEPL